MAFPCALPAHEPPRIAIDPAQSLPSAAISANQQRANAIADTLRQSGQLRDYLIDITYRDGIAELSGTVLDQPQREEVLRVVQGIPGVERVVDRLTLAGAITQVQNPGNDAILPRPNPLNPGSGPDLGGNAGTGNAGGNNSNLLPEPIPSFTAAAPSPFDAGTPRMPPYAWPTYAPYNNYSRVAYPLAYPYHAWPFIGPVYPFPKVPPGWRKVKLEWDDGYWWFSKLGTKHDWWRLRYW
jgi:hypothetical protein